MYARILTVVLALGLMTGVFTLAHTLWTLPLPGYHTGYEPVQPIAFSHLKHAGELQIDCQYCHFGADESRHAGIPPGNVCMNCHGIVTAPWADVRAEAEAADAENRAVRRIVSPELQKLYDAMGLGDDLKPDPGKTPVPIPWVKVHKFPDFAYFNHQAHVSTGMTCQTCHGPVETMVRMRQVGDMSMGWCIQCHRDPTRYASVNRDVQASVDCSVCHY